ncbi:hypothetical protein [Sphingobium sp.]|uniref:hypothetical protein n=1 Tax=Sphingobium sp. TaxID=1912891 RepID=UPI003B3BC4C0
MVVGLLSELWVMRDRIAVLEELLVKSGTLGADAIESFEWPQSQAEEMEALRDRIVAAVIGAPIAAKERSVDKILARAGYERPVAA